MRRATTQVWPPCQRCGLLNPPERTYCPFCGNRVAVFAVSESPGAAAARLALRVSIRTIAPARRRRWPRVLIRVALGLTLLALVLRAGVQATGSVPYVPRTVPAATLMQ